MDSKIDVANVVPSLEAQCVAEEKRTYRRIATALCLGCLLFLYNFPLHSLTGPPVAGCHGKSQSHFSLESTQLAALGEKFLAESSTAESLFIENPSTEILMDSLRHYTKHPHLAGNLALARYTRDKWLAAGIKDVEIVEYEVLLNYPTNASQISLYDHKEKLWSATLQEDVLNEDPGSAEAVPFFHGYSKNGSASGQLVYVNYGRPEDYALAAEHVDLTGKIAIARYGKLFRGLKVELAQRHGMSAVLLYDDPSEDHDITVANGYAAYPKGIARNPSAVQRGSVQFLSVLPGDPTTPGYPSTPGCDRQDPYKSVPSIPSIPINGRDALYLLKTLNGQGPVIKDFVGALPGVKYNIGGEAAFTLDLDNVVEYDYRPIYNVIAKIPGHFDDTIILGNHRDAWVRGASDPNSGSTALDSVVSTFGALQRTGFQPLRSLIFASWDAEEYGLVGSTEWVEEHSHELSEHAIAYLNLDAASSGTYFTAEASPLLFDVLHNVTAKVPAVGGDASLPGTQPITSLRDEWSGKIGTLGSGSDYTAFQDALGITSMDMNFRPSKAIYHYHSQYDSFHWLTKFGDPGLKALQASARLYGLLAYTLSESPVIGFSATTYAKELIGYIEALSHFPHLSMATASLDAEHTFAHEHEHKDKDTFDHQRKKKEDNKALRKVLAQGHKIHHYAKDLDARAANANAEVKSWPGLEEREKQALLRRIHALNAEYKAFERVFLDHRGLPDRSFFKHVLYAPGRWTGYAGAIFPSITEAQNAEEREAAIERVYKILKRVGRK